MRNVKEYIYRISAVSILFSALLYLFLPALSPWIMLVSVLLFGAATALSPYPGKSLRGKRLFGFQILSCMCMAVAAYLMLKNNNLWALSMLIGAVFLIYPAFMIPRVLEKEKSEQEDV